MGTESYLVDEDRRRLVAGLITQKVRPVAASWSESEQRIAVALIKFLINGEPSKLLVRRIMHIVPKEATPVPRRRTPYGAVVVSYVELDQYVGLRPEQQALIEQCFEEACNSVALPSDVLS